MDLAFEDVELVAECENLDLECGFGLPAEDKEVEQGADDGVQGAQIMARDHDHRSGQMSAPPHAIIGGRVTGTIHFVDRRP